MPNSLEKSIIATIVYCDIFNFPLTATEVFHLRLNRPESIGAEFRDVVFALKEDLVLRQKYIDCENGFYFMKGRGGLFATRIKRQKIADEKWKIVKKAAGKLQCVPFIKLVMASGSLALGNTRHESDFDLLIATAAGRIWTARFFANVVAYLTGFHRTPENFKNKLCLNHFITDKSLQIEFESVYNAFTYSNLVPVWERGVSYEQFKKANYWIKNFIAGPDLPPPAFRKREVSFVAGAVAAFWEFLLGGRAGDVLEKLLKKIQLAKISRDPRTRERGGRIVASDKCLAFHPLSPEAGVIARFNAKMAELGFEEIAQEKDSGIAD